MLGVNTRWPKALMMLSRREESWIDWNYCSTNQQGASTNEEEKPSRTEEAKEARHDAEAEIDQERWS
jgi:hypothetical protein